jgi:hypothetical protein
MAPKLAPSAQKTAKAAILAAPVAHETALAVLMAALVKESSALKLAWNALIILLVRGVPLAFTLTVLAGLARSARRLVHRAWTGRCAIPV